MRFLDIKIRCKNLDLIKFQIIYTKLKDSKIDINELMIFRHNRYALRVVSLYDLNTATIYNKYRNVFYKEYRLLNLDMYNN